MIPVLLFSSLIYLWTANYYRYAGLNSQFEEKNFVDNSSAPTWLRFFLYIFYMSVMGLIGAMVASTRIRWPRPVYVSLLFYAGMWIYSFILLAFFTNDPKAYLTNISYLSTKLAPGALLVVGLFFVGANPYCWRQAPRYVAMVALACVALILFGLCNIDFSSRLLGRRYLLAPGTVLELLTLVPFAYLVEKKKKIWSYLAFCLGAGSVVLCGVFTQTRLFFVTLMTYLLVYFILRLRQMPTRAAILQVFKTVSILIVAVIVGAGLFQHFHALSGEKEGAFVGSLVGLSDRIDEDSRSYQYTVGPFFNHFWSSFPWGAGYPDDDQYNGEGEEGIDNGYLNSILITGLPMMICFVSLLCIPLLRSLFLKLNPVDSAIVAGAFTYAVRLATSTVLSTGLTLVIFVLFAGRCAYLVQAHADNLIESGGPPKPRH